MVTEKCSLNPARPRAVLTVAAVLFGLTGTAVASETEDGVQTKPGRTELRTPRVSVPFDVTADRPVVEIMVNGGGPYRLAIETAGKGATLDNDVVRELRMHPAGASAPQETKREAWRMPRVARVELLEMNGAVFADFPAMVREYDSASRSRRPYDGTLGLSVFADCLFTVDYRRQRLLFKQTQLPPSNGRDVLDYTDRQGLPVIRLLFGDLPVDLTIDTSSVEAFVLAESLKGKIELAPEWETDLGGDQAHVSGTVRLGKHMLVEPPVRFRGSSSLVGQNVLHFFSVTFDQKNHRVRFRRADNSLITFDSASKFGLVFERFEGRVKLKDVVPGSPAARVGLRVGEIVLKIEGRRAYEYDAYELRKLQQESTVILMTVGNWRLPMLVRLEAQP